MGTRCGDVDPAVHAFLARNCGMDIEEIDSMLNKEFRTKGVFAVLTICVIFMTQSKMVMKEQNWHLMYKPIATKKYVGAYLAALGRVDAIIFTAGIGGK